MTTFKGFGDFAARAPKMLKRGLHEAGTELQRLTIEGVSEKMDSLNPPRSTREHRHFTDSWFFTKNGRRAGQSVPTTKAGDKLGRANDAPHAAILDNGLTVTGQGRRRLPRQGRRGTVPAGRRIGTTAAPRGYSKPALLHARSRRAFWMAKALGRAARHL